MAGLDPPMLLLLLPQEVELHQVREVLRCEWVSVPFTGTKACKHYV
jgi:hypothetical protein